MQWRKVEIIFNVSNLYSFNIYALMFLPNSNICVLDSELPCKWNIESRRLLLILFFHEQGRSSLRRFINHAFFQNNVSLVFNCKFISFSTYYFIDSPQLYINFNESVTNAYNRSKYHAIKDNSFERLLSFNTALFCVVFLFVFELPWSTMRLLASFSLFNDFATRLEFESF